MNLSKRFLPIFLVCSILTEVKPISEDEVIIGASAGAIVVGAAAGAGGYFLLKDDNNPDRRNIISGSLAVGVCLISGHFIYKHLHQETPSYTIGQEQELIGNVSSDLLISQKFANDDDFISYIQSCSSLKQQQQNVFLLRQEQRAQHEEIMRQLRLKNLTNFNTASKYNHQNYKGIL